MPLSSYSQSLDSSLLRELNEEFLKGIAAREKVVLLKKVIAADSVQIHMYRDSIVPLYDHLLDTAEVEIVRYEAKVQAQGKTIKLLSYISGFLAILSLGLII